MYINIVHVYGKRNTNYTMFQKYKFSGVKKNIKSKIQILLNVDAFSHTLSRE